MIQYFLVAVGNIQIGKNNTFFFFPPFKTTVIRYLECFGFPSKPSKVCQAVSPTDPKAGSRRPVINFLWFGNCRHSNTTVLGARVALLRVGCMQPLPAEPWLSTVREFSMFP